jgi:feruloyl esterase
MPRHISCLSEPGFDIWLPVPFKWFKRKLLNMKYQKFTLCTVLFQLVTYCSLAQSGEHIRPSVPDCHCDELKNLVFPNTIITTAECVEAGMGGTQAMKDLPAFCRVAATLMPTPDSKIRIEVWLPAKNWNSRFLGTGNGGGAGGISHGGLINGLNRGFAVANTDMGTSPGANKAVGHPEKWVDFGYRATHEMTVVGKAITEAYYRRAIQKAYFVGCSTGGQQALMEAQRFPDDYDGILAGAPANNRTHLHTGFVWNYKVTNGAGGAVLPKAKLSLVNRAILNACAGKDGGAPGDRFLTDPGACAFDLNTLPVCPDGTDDSTCLTPIQSEVLKKIYQGPTNPRTGERIYTPIPFASESITAGIEYQQSAMHAPAALFYQYKWVFGEDFDYTSFDFDRDQAKLDSTLAPILNANNPDLEPLRKRGSKLLMYSGTADPLVPYQDAVHYYDRVVEKQGSLKKTQMFFRFFLIPGMAHCGGGPGLNDCGQNLALQVPQDKDHDVLTALMNWVEKGMAPEKLIAAGYHDGVPSKGVRLQRPIYPYPKLPVYKSGDPLLPDNYKGVSFPSGRVLVPGERYLN